MEVGRFAVFAEPVGEDDPFPLEAADAAVVDEDPELEAGGLAFLVKDFAHGFPSSIFANFVLFVVPSSSPHFSTLPAFSSARPKRSAAPRRLMSLLRVSPLALPRNWARAAPTASMRWSGIRCR
jgi:hypothetical protein